MPADTTNEAPTIPAPDPTDTGGRTDQELAHEIIAFEKQFGPPDQDGFIADARWYEEQWEASAFEPYRGTHIAVFNRAVVGSGWDSLQLQLDVVRKFNVHPQRVIIAYIPPRAF